MISAGDAEGMPAIEQLISEGINVNVTLLFAQEAYEQVVRLISPGSRNAPRKAATCAMASAASFFISRIDTAVDALLSERLKTATAPVNEPCCAAYWARSPMPSRRISSIRSCSVARAGRPWPIRVRRRSGSCGPARVPRIQPTATCTSRSSSVPIPSTLCRPRRSMPSGTMVVCGHGSRRTLKRPTTPWTRWRRWGLMAEVTNTLLDEGVQLFAEAFDKLLAAVEQTRQAAAAPKITQQTSSRLPLAAAVRGSLDDWRAGNKVRRLWAHDATLWTGTDEGEWLGWLGLTEEHAAHSDYLKRLAAEAESRLKDAGVTHALLLGMGGSSLGPEVLQTTFGSRQGFPQFYVLDSTDPAQIKAFENTIDLAHTLFIVSSKSGSTLEPNIFKQYFFQRVQEALGRRRGGRLHRHHRPRLEAAAHRRERRLPAHFLRPPQHRRTVFSPIKFWHGPAAIMGLDISWFLDHVEEMVHACAATVPVEENPRCWDHPGRAGYTVGQSHAITSPASRTSVPGWNSCWQNPRARMARA